MTILCLNVPRDKAEGEGKKSYADTLNSAVGSGYAIASHIILRLHTLDAPECWWLPNSTIID